MGTKSVFISWAGGCVYASRPALLCTTFAVLCTFAQQYHKEDIWLRQSFCYTTTFYVGLTFLISGITVLMGQRVSFYREKAAGMYSSNMYGLAYMLVCL